MFIKKSITHLKKKGSIALINLLVLSTIMMLLAIVASELSVTGSYNYLNYNSNQSLFHVAESCLEESIIRLEEDLSVSSLTVNLNDAVCNVGISGSGTKLISIDVSRDDYSQNYLATVSFTVQGQANNGSLVDWQRN